MIAAWLAVVQKKLPAKPQGWDPRLLWTTLALVAIILMGAVLVALLERWRKRAAPAVFDPNDQLARFRELYERGELSQKEFDRIRERLGREIRHEVDLPAPPAPENPKTGQPAKDGPIVPRPERSASHPDEGNGAPSGNGS